ncbi:MAG: hypothetical protein ABI867_21135 [Kofleriaceae bacterium]
MLVFASCGPEHPPAAPVASDPDAALVHTWKIADHVLAPSTTLTERDATELHGREVDLRAGTYVTPWQGSCDDVGRQRRARVLADVALELTVDRAALVRFGLGNDLVEYRLTCNGSPRTPPLLLFVAGTRALTCFAGACYLLTH